MAHDLAREHNGLMAIVEHRFYGGSLPFGPVESFSASPDRIGLLTSKDPSDALFACSPHLELELAHVGIGTTSSIVNRTAPTATPHHQRQRNGWLTRSRFPAVAPCSRTVDGGLRGGHPGDPEGARHGRRPRRLARWELQRQALCV